MNSSKTFKLELKDWKSVVFLLGVIFILPHEPGALLQSQQAWCEVRSPSPCPPAMSVKPAILVAMNGKAQWLYYPEIVALVGAKATEQRTDQKFNKGIQEIKQP